jgi:hypothetical protein
MQKDHGQILTKEKIMLLRSRDAHGHMAGSTELSTAFVDNDPGVIGLRLMRLATFR